MQQKPKTAAEYQAEMMQLYRRAHPAPEPTAESSSAPTESAVTVAPTTPTNPFPPAPDLPPASDNAAAPEPSATLPENLPPEIAETPIETTSELPSTSDTAPLPDLFPENLPPEITGEPDETTSESSLTSDTASPSELPTPVVELEPVPTTHPNTAYGFLKVITRTGSEAMPLPNVTVTVTAMEGANSRLYFSGVTNESGETDHIPLPAPELIPDASPTNRQLYQNYDVVVYHPDYFRMESRGLPIFPGITSLQKFAMIPLPQRPGDNPPTVVYENTEPRFPD